MASTLRSSRTHRESVGCGTPTASANCVALTACGPTNRFTTRALNAALYTGIVCSTCTPNASYTVDALTPAVRQLS
jgi:hypothetical protein